MHLMRTCSIHGHRKYPEDLILADSSFKIILPSQFNVAHYLRQNNILLFLTCVSAVKCFVNVFHHTVCIKPDKKLSLDVVVHGHIMIYLGKTFLTMVNDFSLVTLESSFLKRHV